MKALDRYNPRQRPKSRQTVEEERRPAGGGGRVGPIEAQQRPTPPPLPPLRSGATNWRQWAIGAIVLALIIFVAQNAQRVEVHFFFATVKAPLVFALLIAVVLGILVGWLVPRLRRGGAQPKQD